MKITVLRAMFFSLMVNGCYAEAQRTNYLKEVQHHTGYKDHDVQLGKISLFFERDPIVHKLGVADGAQTFFFPMTEISARSRNDIARKLQTCCGVHYKVRLLATDTPVRGLKLSIEGDMNRVGVVCDVCDSIGLRKEVVLRLYNKEIIRSLRDTNRPIITTVANKSQYKVVLDYGHGGADPGAIGCFNIQEKDICLAIGLQAAQLLKQRGVDVHLTRATDVTCPLDMRTRSANEYEGHLFVSIHANHAAQDKASGIETYCITPSLFSNRFSTLESRDYAVAHTMSVTRSQKSSALASSLQTSLITAARSKNPHAVDRRVKNAVSQVLLGVSMPAALVEVGFLSNKHEAQLLANASYQKKIAQGICVGIIRYLSENIS